MREPKLQRDVTLLDVLVDGFEKNEILHGFHWRNLPMPDEPAAVSKFTALAAEARRWKGPPARVSEESARRLIAWRDLEIRQAGRGIMVRVRAPWFEGWWHDADTWRGDPMGSIDSWIVEEAKGSQPGAEV